ncbi:FAD-binding and (Fe-S)-binding domain-containing protein [Nocardioides sp. NPDC023903]|uniref:FAD-binding and (Fe-S)-binding domain-containing protein n=1 Tax=Nocardioides sp. NPDC023903 TaxID=3157195 RepID=UPI0033E38047
MDRGRTDGEPTLHPLEVMRPDHQRKTSSVSSSGECSTEGGSFDAIQQVNTTLTRQGVSIDDSALTKSLYASDASIYRVAPAAVAFPRGIDEIDAIVEACRANGVSVTSRGAGTSIAGNAVGPGVVIDHSRYLNSVLAIDPASRTARVQAGVAHATLQRAALAEGLRFGPDPSSHSRCTIGGMIGNNACGSRALGYGRTSDNVLGLDLLTASGEHLGVGSLARAGFVPSPLEEALRATAQRSLATIRTNLGRFGRQVSGYSLEHLLPERGFDLTKALVGTEGTLGVVVEADVRLVKEPAHRVLVVLGFADMIAAAAAVPPLLAFGPTACEGLDRRITDAVRAKRGAGAVPDLPRGSGWLFVEIVGDVPEEVNDTAARVAASSDAVGSRVVRSASEMAALWRIREDGSGLVARTSSGRPAHAGWEDAAVPPSQLASYLEEFEDLLGSHRYQGVPYGHFGDGCVHVRIDFELEDDAGRQRFGDFLTDAAHLVAKYGGSMSGEHGDGRARSELLKYMYAPEVLDLFAEVKRHFDPNGLFNPGVIVDPAAAIADVRYSKPQSPSNALAFLYPDDSEDLVGAVHRCTGVGRCVAPTANSGTAMCPSFRATREEKDSTRGRARVLQDAVSGNLGPAGLASSAVADALELCLSCKACRSDCPTGVDMAKYKAEVLHQKYRRRLRPRSHYSLGFLPLWLRAAGLAPALFNAVSKRGTPSLLAWLAGIDERRSIPALAGRHARAEWSRNSEVRRSSGHGEPATTSKDVVLFVDTFSDSFAPRSLAAVLSVLKAAGYRVHVPNRRICCGLTWISTGQLTGARRRLRDTAKVLHPFVERGMKVLGLEPSCTAALRSDLAELVDTPEAREVASAVSTLAELLQSDPDYQAPRLAGVEILAQPHCHHRAIFGWSADLALLEATGASVTTVDGCCGLAGNFGVERGHYDVSVAIAEDHLLPAVRQAPPNTVVLADGFSCRTQIDALAHRTTVHLAELLDTGPSAFGTPLN